MQFLILTNSFQVNSHEWLVAAVLDSATLKRPVTFTWQLEIQVWSSERGAGETKVDGRDCEERGNEKASLILDKPILSSLC